ncbi:hypothetical protein PLICRDRAFT_181132 [Plicaturopsis crispa FD-325 SS-3]|uniref:Unplaced genomic scaffold PLICRscaffold_185, whole genome shotgun sequence n=1 Tax=Plicaturopsis crispa FD-325 SS-3 TaxID=944288 RepID=A0A0C9SJW8_PLICR|nr:hypothetical protein PLICRDRAFT_181132 [Plicaturopsis crispa FD-325 SS-3]
MALEKEELTECFKSRHLPHGWLLFQVEETQFSVPGPLPSTTSPGSAYHSWLLSLYQLYDVLKDAASENMDIPAPNPSASVWPITQRPFALPTKLNELVVKLKRWTAIIPALSNDWNTKEQCPSFTPTNANSLEISSNRDRASFIDHLRIPQRIAGNVQHRVKAHRIDVVNIAVQLEHWKIDYKTEGLTTLRESLKNSFAMTTLRTPLQLSLTVSPLLLLGNQKLDQVNVRRDALVIAAPIIQAAKSPLFQFAERQLWRTIIAIAGGADSDEELTRYLTWYESSLASIDNENVKLSWQIERSAESCNAGIPSPPESSLIPQRSGGMDSARLNPAPSLQAPPSSAPPSALQAKNPTNSTSTASAPGGEPSRDDDPPSRRPKSAKTAKAPAPVSVRASKRLRHPVVKYQTKSSKLKLEAASLQRPRKRTKHGHVASRKMRSYSALPPPEIEVINLSGDDPIPLDLDNKPKRPVRLSSYLALHAAQGHV